MPANNKDTNNRKRKRCGIKSATNNNDFSLSIIDLDGTSEWEDVEGCYMSLEEGGEVFFEEWVLKEANRRLEINLHSMCNTSVYVVWHKKDQAVQKVFENLLRVGENVIQNNVTRRIGCLVPIESRANERDVDYDWDRSYDIQSDDRLVWANAESVRDATRCVSGEMNDITTAHMYIRYLVNKVNCGFDLVAHNWVL